MVENYGRKKMTIQTDSFRCWLTHKIVQVLKRNKTPSPFIIWCDPQRVWKDILKEVAAGEFELWADEEHELIMRQRFYQSPRLPRVIYLPLGREKITYFKVFEVQAEEVIEITILEALSEYGVHIQSEMLAEIEPLLPAHTKEWIDQPKSKWKELTVGNAKETLVDDELILKVLTSVRTEFGSLIDDNKYPIFVRRVSEDFGLPEPREMIADSWRASSLAALLCTEAAELCPDTPPHEPGKIIAAGPARKNALNLLRQWKNRFDLISSFEDLIEKAENITSLRMWESELKTIPPPLSSKIVEKALFEKEILNLNEIETPEELVNYLKKRQQKYKEHSEAFWGKLARKKVPWSFVTELSLISSLLFENVRVENKWKSPIDAIAWYTSTGWKIDRAVEMLFEEDGDSINGVDSIRARLRRTYLRCVDQTNSMFSELLSRSGFEELRLQYAGDIIEPYIKKNEPTAVLFIDAFRYDLGCRLAEMLNLGEPAERATVLSGRAPLPSITALGMPYALPGAPLFLQTTLNDLAPRKWLVISNKMTGDMTIADNRREWLRATYKVTGKAFLTISEIIEPTTKIDFTVRTLGKLLFIFGSEFDQEGHEGQLKFDRIETHLERYSRAIRKLRDAGYSTILLATDHGFFNWEPEKDEIQLKPSGDILWVSRRAVVGEKLEHQTALKLPVTGSKLTCLVPRSVNAFKVYGGLGFFHGGATLQELVIPIVVARWPKLSRKTRVVLKPVTEITSLTPRIEIGPGTAVQVDLSGALDSSLLSRDVFVKAIDPNSGKVLFKSGKVHIEPGGQSAIAELNKLEGAEASTGAMLQILVCDLDDEEILDQANVVLKVALDEWF
jgi:hypothetical protein